MEPGVLQEESESVTKTIQDILRVESIERIGTEPVADARGSANSRAAKLRQCPSKGCLLKEFENSIKGNSGGSH